jgi:hypothetical protein
MEISSYGALDVGSFIAVPLPLSLAGDAAESAPSRAPETSRNAEKHPPGTFVLYREDAPHRLRVQQEPVTMVAGTGLPTPVCYQIFGLGKFSMALRAR